MNELCVRVEPLECLQQLLPDLVRNLSIGRAQIAVDQLRSAVAENADQVLLVTVSRTLEPHAACVDGDERVTTETAEHKQDILAAAVAIQSIERGHAERSDAACLVHAGPLSSIEEPLLSQVVVKLKAVIDQELRHRGVEFIQWATAPLSSLSPRETQCCELMGYHQIAELDYLSGSIINPTDRPHRGDDLAEHDLGLQAIDSTNEASLKRFADLIHRTYVDTMDCPAIAEFRTAAQTLRGYQRTQPIESRLWFQLVDRQGKPVGCVVMSHHAAAENDVGVIELVYMGLVPESRGRGIGRAVLGEAMRVARQHGAGRMILAVDKKNHPARRIYDDTGFTPILGESIWVNAFS